MNTPGFDMSRYQDNGETPFRPNLPQAHAKGMEFVVIRAIYCGRKDRDFDYNFKEARDTGMIVGTYGFPDYRKPAAPQAREYVDILKDDLGDFLSGDFEAIPGPTIGSFIPFPAAAPYRKWAEEYLAELVKLAGRKTLFYSSPNVIQNVMTIPGNSGLLKYPLWIANYGVSRPWTNPWPTWTLWQYALGKDLGQQFGMESKDIDLDYYNGSLKQMQEWLALTPPVPLTLEQRVERLERKVFS
jgi:lysozyme